MGERNLDKVRASQTTIKKVEWWQMCAMMRSAGAHQLLHG